MSQENNIRIKLIIKHFTKLTCDHPKIDGRNHVELI